MARTGSEGFNFVLQLSRSSAGLKFDNPNLKLFPILRDDSNSQKMAASVCKLAQCF
jgi:hypothetical protein